MKLNIKLIQVTVTRLHEVLTAIASRVGNLKVETIQGSIYFRRVLIHCEKINPVLALEEYNTIFRNVSLAMHDKHNLQTNHTSFFQLMWTSMQEISWRLPRSFSFILLVCNVKISQQQLKSLERRLLRWKRNLT